MSLGALACGLLFLIAGCASGPPSSEAFSAAEYEALPARGTATVEGRALVTRSGGVVEIGSGVEVALTPVTALTQDLFGRGELRAWPWSDDPRVAATTRVVTAEADGSFRFEGVPAGSHFAVTRVTWTVPGGRYGGVRERGEWLAARVEVPAGGTAAVTLGG